MEAKNPVYTPVYGMDALDALTGVFDCGYLEENLPEAILSCRKQGQSLSLIYADIDRFTQINERCGRSRVAAHCADFT